MDMVARQHASALDDLQRGIADLAVDAHVTADPTLEARYGTAVRRIWRTEAASRLSHLAAAVACGRPAMFAVHAERSAAALRAREVPDPDFRTHLRTLAETLNAELPPFLAAQVAPFLAAANAALERAPSEHPGLLEDASPDSTLARLYLLRLMERDREAATTLAVGALQAGRTLGEVYERILAPAMAEVGRMWHSQEAGIADEHFCTAATRLALTRLRAALPTPPADGRRALFCSVDGDMHDLGLRMAADLLEVDGWTIEFLGANVPASEVVIAVEEAAEVRGRPFDLVAATAATQLSVRAAIDLVEALRASAGGRDVKIMFGGGGFAADPALAADIGADGSAATLTGAVAEAARLVPRARSARR